MITQQDLATRIREMEMEINMSDQTVSIDSDDINSISQDIYAVKGQIEELQQSIEAKFDRIIDLLEQLVSK